MAETVLVTGVSGFIARHVALALLKDGYAVRGTVRSKAKGESVVASLAAHGADKTKIAVVEANLENDAGWREAARGCAGVMHVASPFPMAQPRDRNALTPAARDGALRVIDAALDAGVPKIVMTSSMVAMMYRPNRPAHVRVGESDWTDLSWNRLSAYVVSKTEAEKAAWARVETRGARERLAVVNPGIVYGPALDKDIGASLEIVKLFLEGAYPAVPPVSFPVVDVRDVAALHVAALKLPKAGGRRLIAASGTLSMKQMAEIIKDAAPQFARKIPSREMPAALIPILATFNRNLAAVLPDLGSVPEPDFAYVAELTGIRFRSPKEATAAAVKSLISVGAV